MRKLRECARAPASRKPCNLVGAWPTVLADKEAHAVYLVSKVLSMDGLLRRVVSLL